MPHLIIASGDAAFMLRSSSLVIADDAPSP
jgi:hypothetical protein